MIVAYARQYRGSCSASTLLLCEVRGGVAGSRSGGFCSRGQHKGIALVLKHEKGTVALPD